MASVRGRPSASSRQRASSTSTEGYCPLFFKKVRAQLLCLAHLNSIKDYWLKTKCRTQVQWWWLHFLLGALRQLWLHLKGFRLWCWITSMRGGLGTLLMPSPASGSMGLESTIEGEQKTGLKTNCKIYLSGCQQFWCEMDPVILSSLGAVTSWEPPCQNLLTSLAFWQISSQVLVWGLSSVQSSTQLIPPRHTCRYDRVCRFESNWSNMIPMRHNNLMFLENSWWWVPELPVCLLPVGEGERGRGHVQGCACQLHQVWLSLSCTVLPPQKIVYLKLFFLESRNTILMFTIV